MPGSPARSEQRLKTRTVTGGNPSTYTYDAHGTLVKRVNADGTSTVYVGGVYEATYDAGGALTGTTKYYQAFGRTIAMRSSSVAACASAPCYLLADHLGGTVGLTDNSGNVLSTQKYWPYGAARSGGITQTDKLYTGQQVEPGDSALALYNYKARFYSTTLGRFVSADSMASAASVQSMNRFSYAAANPLRYRDPSGHCFQGLDQPKPYECDETRLNQIIQCAMGIGCSTDAQTYVLAGMKQDEFLVNLTIYGTGVTNLSGGAYAVLTTLFAGAKAGGNLAALPKSFWRVMGETVFAVSGEFLHAAILTLMNGSADIYGVGFWEMMGATPFWQRRDFDAWMGMHPEFGIDFKWSTAVAFDTYVMRTVWVAAFLKSQNLNVNELPWSWRTLYSQRDILSNPDLGLGITPGCSGTACLDPNPAPNFEGIPRY